MRLISRTCAFTAAIVLPACGPSRPSDTLALLESGNPEACSAPDVTSRVKRDLLGNANLLLREGKGFEDTKFSDVKAELDPITVYRVKPSEKSVICNASLYLYGKDDEPLLGTDQELTYEVRPSLGHEREVAVVIGPSYAFNARESLRMLGILK